MNTAKEKTIITKKDGQKKELFGRTFRIVKNGLDEAEIASFMNGLIEENSNLVAKLKKEEEANRIKAEASQKTKELPIEIGATAQKETQNALGTKRELKRHYKQIYEELVANLDSITEITNPSTSGVSITVTLQGVKLPQLHVQPVVERAKAILPLMKGFATRLHQYLLRLFNLLVRWLKSGYLLARRRLQPEIRRVWKAASQLAKAILPLMKGFATRLHQYLLRLFNLLVRWLKSGYLLARRRLQPEIRRVWKTASQLKGHLSRIRRTN